MNVYEDTKKLKTKKLEDKVLGWVRWFVCGL